MENVSLSCEQHQNLNQGPPRINCSSIQSHSVKCWKLPSTTCILTIQLFMCCYFFSPVRVCPFQHLSLFMTHPQFTNCSWKGFHLYNLAVKYSFPAGTWSLQLDFWACGSCPKSKVALLELNMQPPPFGCGVLCGVDSHSDLSYCSAE